MKKDKPRIIIIVGPTASGKSDLAIKLARKLSGEIISADSRQVYRGLDIGTGKVTKKERAVARHHLLDISSPKKVFTVDDFKRLSQKAIFDIASRNKVSIIVGGTGFYIDVLLGRMTVAEVPPNPKLRTKLEKQSTEQLFKRLKKLDPERAETIDHKNKRRLIRALEIVITTGNPVPKYSIQDTKYNLLWIGLKPKKLESRIKKRLDARLRQGMVKEVKGLIKKGVSYKRLYDLGLEYRWISLYLKGSITKNEMTEKLYRDIVRYSKRQMTWFKRNKEIKWLDDPRKVASLLKSFRRLAD